MTRQPQEAPYIVGGKAFCPKCGGKMEAMIYASLDPPGSSWTPGVSFIPRDGWGRGDWVMLTCNGGIDRNRCHYTFSAPLESFRFKAAGNMGKLIVDTIGMAFDARRNDMRAEARLMVLAAIKEHEDRERAQQSLVKPLIDPPETHAQTHETHASDSPCPFKPGDKVEWDDPGDDAPMSGTVESVRPTEDGFDWWLTIPRGPFAVRGDTLASACRPACPFSVGQWVVNKHGGEPRKITKVDWFTSFVPYTSTGWRLCFDDRPDSFGGHTFFPPGDYLPCPPPAAPVSEPPGEPANSPEIPDSSPADTRPPWLQWFDRGHGVPACDWGVFWRNGPLHYVAYVVFADPKDDDTLKRLEAISYSPGQAIEALMAKVEAWKRGEIKAELAEDEKPAAETFEEWLSGHLWKPQGAQDEHVGDMREAFSAGRASMRAKLEAAIRDERAVQPVISLVLHLDGERVEFTFDGPLTEHAVRHAILDHFKTENIGGPDGDPFSGPVNLSADGSLHLPGGRYIGYAEAMP